MMDKKCILLFFVVISYCEPNDVNRNVLKGFTGLSKGISLHQFNKSYFNSKPGQMDFHLSGRRFWPAVQKENRCKYIVLFF